MEMLRLRIDLPSIYSTLRRHRLPPHADDTGYFVHAFLSELFSEKAPSPFRVMGTRGRQLEVLAYSEESADSLASIAGKHSGIPLLIEGKQLPREIPAESDLGFSLVACPVVRMARAGGKHKKGAEVDVFLRECWKADGQQAVDREQAYRAWLASQFRRLGGAEVLHSDVTKITQRGLLRKTQGPERRSQLRNKPEVQFSGALRVTDSERFAHLLRRGVGRHRAFGFGMLLLRRL